MRNSSTARKTLGFVALAMVIVTVIMGLWITPPAVGMGNLVRLLYIHPPMAWVAFLAFGITTLASILYLWKRTRRRAFDLIAASSAEAGVLFTGLTLVTGSIWGRPTWGVWWTWDALLTATAVLFLLYLGYLALRQVPMSEEKRGVRAGIAALIAFIDVPIVDQSVYWWRTLHDKPSVGGVTDSLKVHGILGWTLLLGFLAFTAAYAWMVWVRYDIAAKRAVLEDMEINRAIEERITAGVE